MVSWGLGWGVEYVFPTGFGDGGGVVKIFAYQPAPHLVITDSSHNAERQAR